jgi:hypothetical protein
MENKKAQFGTALKYLGVFIAYSAAFLITALIARRIWGGYQARLDNYRLLFLFYIVPLLLLTGYASWTNNNRKPFAYCTVLYALLLCSVLATFLFHIIAFQVYGDQNQLNYLLSNGTIFPRYLVGSRILDFIYRNLILPLFLKNAPSETVLADVYVRVFGCLLMTAAALLLLKKYPHRLSIILPLILPVWLLFSSGYNEYYPFITPLFMICLLFLDQWNIGRVHPILMGLLTALVALVYAAFIPIALFLLGYYFLRGGIKKGLLALVFAVFWSLALIAICWPGSFANFLHQYIFTLNLGDNNSIEQFVGQALGSSPFFKPAFAFSGDHLRIMFFMLFWTGGIFSTVVLAAAAVLLAVKRQLLNKKFIIPGIFLLYQIAYFFFMIPKLGALQDIDLFFPVYLTIAYVAGMLADHYARSLPEQKGKWYSFICLALVAGNSAYCVFYLLLWGIPLKY